MNLEGKSRLKIAWSAAALLLVTAALLVVTKSFSAGSAGGGLEYFKGDWVVVLKANPKLSFNWSVREDLQGAWMTGVVEQQGRKVSTDFWRRAEGKIERYAFTADGTFVRIEGAGWDSGRLILAGLASDKRGETRIRETITKVSDREFRALWEREENGQWITFSDEICTRAQP